MFGCVVMDPPWRFANTASNGAAEDHYPTLDLRQIARIPVEEWTLPNSHLYLWVPAAFLSDGLRLCEGWGFSPKLPLVWVKVTPAGKLATGLGNWFRHAHELCIFATRGRAPARAHSLPSVFWAVRGKHSGKPEALQDMAERMSPGPYLELFARRARRGWTCLGNELGAELARPVTLPTPIPSAEPPPGSLVEEPRPEKLARAASDTSSSTSDTSAPAASSAASDMTPTHPRGVDDRTAEPAAPM